MSLPAFWIRIFLSLLCCLVSTGLNAQSDEDDDRRVLPNFGDDPDAPVDERFQKAQELHLEGLFSKAYLIYDQILTERPTDVPTIVTYGNMKWKEGDFAEAERRLKRAIEIMPGHIKARQFLGQMYFYQGRRALAREQFDAMHKLDFMRDDILNSAKLNLGKIELLEGNYRQAREHFIWIRGNGAKADRNSGERGLIKMKWINTLDNWPRYDSKHLFIHFSPDAAQFKDVAARQAFASGLDSWIERTCATLGTVVPDPWRLYVFVDDGECSGHTGRAQAHNWDYSWWLSFTSLSSGIDVKHTLSVQLAARAAGSRPISRSTVEGFCAYLAGSPADPHAKARALLAEGRLPNILELHSMQKSPHQLEAGTSLVRWIIDTHGFEKFMHVWKWMNTLTDAPRFRLGRSTETDWEAAFDALYGEAFGSSLLQVDQGWRSFLRGK